MHREFYDKEMNAIKLGSRITDGKNIFGVERISQKLSISIEGKITPLAKLRHNKINTHSIAIKGYSVVK